MRASDEWRVSQNGRGRKSDDGKRKLDLLLLGRHLVGRICNAYANRTLGGGLLIMQIEPFANGGCKSYLVSCDTSGRAILIDPEIHLTERYKAAIARDGLALADRKSVV